MRFVDVLVGDLGIVVGNLDVLVILQLDLRNHLELGLEAQRLAVVEMDVGDVGPADDVQVFRLDLLLQILGDQASSTCWRISPANCLRISEAGALPGRKPGKFGALLNVGNDAAGFRLHLRGGNGDFQRVLATFY